MAEGKLPAIHLYPGDWLRDGVSGCSLAAQGLWLRMMFVAHDSERYGYLEINGSPMQPEAIARRCGCADLAQYETLVSELVSAGVPSSNDAGTLFSRRMVRDAKTRAERVKAGRKGGKQSGKQRRSKREANSQQNPEVESEDDNESLRNKKNSRVFVKPTVDEVTAYCRERANGINAQAFVDHYQSKGWRVGNQAMKDWKSAVRTWEHRRQESSATGSAGGVRLSDKTRRTMESLSRLVGDGNEN